MVCSMSLVISHPYGKFCVLQTLCVLLSDSVLDPIGQSCSRLLLSDLSLIRSEERFLYVRIAVRPLIDSFRRKISLCTNCCQTYIDSFRRKIFLCTNCCQTYDWFIQKKDFRVYALLSELLYWFGQEKHFCVYALLSDLSY